jgi:hypothetical protein
VLARGRSAGSISGSGSQSSVVDREFDSTLGNPGEDLNLSNSQLGGGSGNGMEAGAGANVGSNDSDGSNGSAATVRTSAAATATAIRVAARAERRETEWQQYLSHKAANEQQVPQLECGSRPGALERRSGVARQEVGPVAGDGWVA